jgi:hypothetical protein
MRVLHGPVNIGNQPWVLSRAERNLGLMSDLVVATGSWLDYPADRFLFTHDKGPSGASSWASSRASSWASSWADKVRRAAFGLEASGTYDVLHYYFGQSYIHRPGQRETVLNFADLRLARARGKRIFMTLQGCDVRLAGDSHAAHAVTMCKPEGCRFFSGCVTHQDHVRRAMIAHILPLCDRVFVLNPDLKRHAPAATFLPYANVDIAATALALPRATGRPLVLHAPTDPLIKGSADIETALGVLAGEFDFDYQKITGKPHAEAMQLYARADLVIDQVLAGWYGGFAVELMAMGKPVAAYIRSEDLPVVPPRMAAELPILRIDPRTLVDDLRQILRRRAEWPAMGRASRAFVERWHDPAKVAAALLRVYADPTAALDL